VADNDEVECAKVVVFDRPLVQELLAKLLPVREAEVVPEQMKIPEIPDTDSFSSRRGGLVVFE
jgi:hypothetical protein